MKETSALIGYTGFVGTTLLGQRNFTDLYRSTNINEIKNKRYDFVVAAAAPAKKWLANSKPFEDQKNIDKLIGTLSYLQAERFVLISTVDVFAQPIGVDEDTRIDIFDLQPYGYNRRRLELFVEEKFPNHLIVRLPGLVGRGLRKNIIYDFLNKNRVDQIESRNSFQFYPMSRLWKDIEIALNNNLKLIHLTAEPVTVAEVAKDAFGLKFEQELENPLVQYDFRTRYHSYWGAESPYQYSKHQSLDAIREYKRQELNE